MDILVTKRLTIRPPLEVDGDDLAFHLADAKLRARLPCARNAFGRDDINAWIGARTAAACAGEGTAWTIHRERLIGAIELDGQAGAPKLGWFLGSAWAGQGFMAEALAAVLPRVFARPGVAALRSAAFADDPAALRLQEKLGFVIEGSRRVWSESRGAVVVEFLTRLERSAFMGGRLAAAA